MFTDVYNELPSDLAEQARSAAAEFLRLDNVGAIEKGRLLIVWKEKLGHGNFRRWVEQELGRPERTAERWMAQARWADSKTANMAVLERVPESIVRILASKDVPPEFEGEVLDDFELGRERPTASEVQQRLDQARDAIVKADFVANETIRKLLSLGPERWKQRRGLFRLATTVLSFWPPAMRDAFLAELAAADFAPDPDHADRLLVPNDFILEWVPSWRREDEEEEGEAEAEAELIDAKIR